MTEKLKSIVSSLNAEVKNNSVYVWGGQGEKLLSSGFIEILNKEDTPENAARIAKHVKTLLKSGKSLKNSRIFDCSGLIGQVLIDHKILKSDTTADGIYRKALAEGSKVAVAKMKAGDVVFKVSNGRAVHVGMCVGANGKCVEAMGRDVGVVARENGKGSKWDVAIRVKKWYDDVEVDE